jgi:hypothetical protein
VFRLAPSLHRVPVGLVPRLRRYNGELRLPFIHSARASLPSPGGYLRRAHLFVLDGAERGVVEPGRLTGCPTGLTQETRDLPGSWRTSRVQPASLFDPGGTFTLRPYGVLVLRPPQGTTAAPTTPLSGLDHEAVALPVYASQRRLPGRHATLGSGCGHLSRAAVDPLQGSSERFQFFIHPPLPGFAWRTPGPDPRPWRSPTSPPFRYRRSPIARERDRALESREMSAMRSMTIKAGRPGRCLPRCRVAGCCARASCSPLS